MKGSIQTTSNENSNLKQQNQQYNKQIEDLLDYKTYPRLGAENLSDSVPTTGRTWCQHQAAEAGDGAGGEKPGHRQLQDHVAPRLDQHQQRLVPKESANS